MLKFIAGWILGGFAIFQTLLLFEQPALGFEVTAVELHGVNRTNPEWLKNYLGLTLPKNLNSSDLAFLTQKILNTEVFYDAHLYFSPVTTNSDTGTLVIKVAEKWTWLPVVRGAFGGGTPLFVLGTYDTHTFGRLWTLGAEIRKYGESPLSYLIWAKAPRWREGEHLLSLKYWQNNREREVLDKEFKSIGNMQSKVREVHLSFYFPKNFFGIKLQTGIDLDYYDVHSTKINTPNTVNDVNFESPSDSHDEIRPLANLIYDDIFLNHLNKDGIRFILKGGFLKNDSGMHGHYEAEAFYYKLWPDDWNLAVHGHWYMNTANYFQNQFFLGGLDSIRGLPEGAIYGNRAYYTNIEMRKILVKYSTAWLQGNVFFDAGNAGLEWDDILRKQFASAGLGLKISIPQVNRLVLRLDYAWSLSEPQFSGFSFGFNSFVQPYRPI